MAGLKNQQIELVKLVIHPNNVRGDQSYDEDGIKALAQNIDEFGLFQNLVVQALEDSKFGVLGGGRRLKALLHLKASERLDMQKIPCRVVPKDMPWQTAISLAENMMQERMNPIDEFNAFASMVDQGQTAEKIAGAFAITLRQVTERLRYGRVHPDIRVAARAGEITLDALKAFAVHPCQETQKRVFDDLSTKGNVYEWSVRQRLKEVDIVLGDPLARFVADDYEAKGGDVIPALFEEETVLKDRGLVEEIALAKLQARADEIAAVHGFAWAEGRMAVDYGDLSTFGRIYPERGEPSDRDAARLEAIQGQLEALDAKIGAADDDEVTRLEEAYDKLNDEAEQIEQACERYDPDAAARAGVIVTFSSHGPEMHAGLIQPEGRTSTASSGNEERHERRKKDFELSRALVGDLGVERADAVAAALLDQRERAQDALLFAIAGKVLADGLHMQGIELACRSADRGHSRSEARDASTLQAIEIAHQALDLTWLDHSLSEGEQFVAFCALNSAMKSDVAAWCLGALISPGLTREAQLSGHDSFVQTLAALALPDIRARWMPTEADYWSRVTKGHMLDLLHQFGMDGAVQEMQSARKTTLADYMERLFANPFVTLTAEQDAAVRAWAPNGMTTNKLVTEEAVDEDDIAA